MLIARAHQDTDVTEMTPFFKLTRACPLSGSIMAGEMYTYLCKECREIVDVLTFPHGEKAEKIKCPECGSEKLELWNPIKGKCPKCGGKFEETGMMMMLD